MPVPRHTPQVYRSLSVPFPSPNEVLREPYAWSPHAQCLLQPIAAKGPATSATCAILGRFPIQRPAPPSIPAPEPNCRRGKDIHRVGIYGVSGGNGICTGATSVVVVSPDLVVLAPAWLLAEGPSPAVFLHAAKPLENPRGKVIFFFLRTTGEIEREWIPRGGGDARWSVRAVWFRDAHVLRALHSLPGDHLRHPFKSSGCVKNISRLLPAEVTSMTRPEDLSCYGVMILCVAGAFFLQFRFT